MNDILDNVQKWIYADDLAIWCSATVRVQGALKRLEAWTKKWLVDINARKTTYTVCSLVTKGQRAYLQVNGHVLPKDKTITYLGRTFGPRMTWKQQIDKCTTRARLRTALMKKAVENIMGSRPQNTEKIIFWTSTISS